MYLATRGSCRADEVTQGSGCLSWIHDASMFTPSLLLHPSLESLFSSYIFLCSSVFLSSTQRVCVCVHVGVGARVCIKKTSIEGTVSMCLAFCWHPHSTSSHLIPSVCWEVISHTLFHTQLLSAFIEMPANLQGRRKPRKNSTQRKSVQTAVGTTWICFWCSQEATWRLAMQRMGTGSSRNPRKPSHTLAMNRFILQFSFWSPLGCEYLYDLCLLWEHHSCDQS